jgi:hypothetical protein
VRLDSRDELLRRQRQSTGKKGDQGNAYGVRLHMRFLRHVRHVRVHKHALFRDHSFTLRCLPCPSRFLESQFATTLHFSRLLIL